MMFQAVMTNIQKDTPPEEIWLKLTELISELNKRTDANVKIMRSFIERFEPERNKQLAKQVPISQGLVNKNEENTINSSTPSSKIPKPSGRSL